MDLSRRSFLVGGAASLFGAGALAATGCNHKIGDKESGNTNSIKASLVDTFDSLDFLGTANPTVAAISWHIFEGLYNINPQTNEVYPALADGDPIWVDDLTYDVKIRDDAKFSNDSKVRAGDIINSFTTAKNKDSVNYMLEFIDSVKANDSDKVTFKLKRPLAGALKKRLSLVQIFPASASITDIEKSPVGTGPYAITEIDGSTGSQVKFSPNSNYNGRLSMPKDPMVWTINPDMDSRAGTLKGSAVYLCEDFPLPKMYEARDAGISVEFSEGFESCIFFFSTIKSPFNKKEVRQALFYAVNEQQIVDEKLEGHGEAATCFLARSNEDYHPASTCFRYNPEKAKEILANNNLSSMSLNIVFDKNCWAYNFKDIILKNLEDVGIKCNAIDTELRLKDTAKKLAELDYDVCLSTVDRSFHGANADILLNFIYFPADKLNQITGYPSSQNSKYITISDLVEQAAATADMTKQRSIYNKIFDILADEAFYYPIIHREQVTAYYPQKILGFKPVPCGGLYLLGSSLA